MGKTYGFSMGSGGGAALPRPMSWMREPLVHFVVFGGLLVGLDAAQEAEEPPLINPIEITREHVAELKLALSSSGEEPSAERLEHEIQRFAEHEAMVREARRLGLDKGDLIIRRRLIQKMEFLVDDMAEVQEPTESELKSWRASHPEKYRRPARYDLEHTFYSTERRRAAADDDAAAALAAWRAQRIPPVGDPFLGGAHIEGRTREQLARALGPEFASAVAEAEGPEWQGPMPSRYGHHLVRILRVHPATDPRFDAVRDRVRTDLLADRHRQAASAARRKLLERYPVVRLAREVER